MSCNDQRLSVLSCQKEGVYSNTKHLRVWDFPARMNWRVHRRDLQCQSGRCPPGICVAQNEKLRYGLHTPAISKTDGNDVSVGGKVAFLQAWLFFGALTEVSSLCGLEFDAGKMFASGDPNTVSTAELNGLPMRLFTASQRRRLAGRES